MSSGLEFNVNASELIGKLDRTNSVLQSGVKRGAHDVLNLWQAEARHDAPHDTGTLEKNIEQKLRVSAGLNVDMELSSNAYNNGFNYAYYQHEVRGNKYLERATKRIDPRIKLILGNEIRKSIMKAGW